MSSLVERFTRTDLLKAVRRSPEKTPIVSARVPDAQAKQAAVAAAKAGGVQLGGDRGARLTAKQRAAGRALHSPSVPFAVNP